MARKYGCPHFFSDWEIEILSRASTAQAPVWLRILGLNSFELSLEAETEDTSCADSLWSEPSVVKRSGKLILEGRPQADCATAAVDAGLNELNYHAALGGCAGDARIRLTDPFGQARIIDLVVTGWETQAEAEGESLRYECEIVGAPEDSPYVQLTGIAAEPAAITLAPGETATAQVSFTPESASNKKFSAFSADPALLRVSASGDTLTLAAVAAGKTTVTLRSMNNRLTAAIAVTIT